MRIAALFLSVTTTACGASNSSPGAGNDTSPTTSAGAAHRVTGFATLPAATFLAGPTSGQFIDSANGVEVPFDSRQPVQGISSAVPLTADRFLAVSDNGFGAPENSADYVLRTYEFEVVLGEDGRGQLEIVGGFTLSDPDRILGFDLIADSATYPGTDAPVDEAIRNDRLLTGADLDLESIQPAVDGGWWFGEELGPFLIRANATGQIIAPPVQLPSIVSPQHPDVPDVAPTIGRSAGFEPLARDATGNLLAMIEKPMLEEARGADAQGELRLFTINEDGTARRTPMRYRLESGAVAATDLAHVAGDVFVTIERDDGDGPTPEFKRIYVIDFGTRDDEGFATKTLLVDLLAIPDPDGIAGATGTFRFPFQTPETVMVLGPSTLAIVSDNNYPFGNARSATEPDGTEWIRIEFDAPIADAIR